VLGSPQQLQYYSSSFLKDGGPPTVATTLFVMRILAMAGTPVCDEIMDGLVTAAYEILMQRREQVCVCPGWVGG